MKFTKIIASAKGLAYKPERHDDGGWEPVLRSYEIATESLSVAEYNSIMSGVYPTNLAPSEPMLFNNLSDMEEVIEKLNSFCNEQDWYYQFRFPTEAEYETAVVVHDLPLQDGHHMTSSCYSKYGQKKDRILKGAGAPEDRGSMNFIPEMGQCFTFIHDVKLRVCRTLKNPAPGVLVMDDPNSPFNKF